MKRSRKRNTRQSQHRTHSKKRQRRSPVRFFVPLLFIILCGIFLYKGKDTLGSYLNHSGKGSGNAKALVIENLPEEPKRPRVPNTATEEHHKTNGLAICMYHYIYDENDPPEDLNNNYIEINALEEELQYLIDEEYYFPTWAEVREYIDGELLLPEKSIVLTFDDGAKDTLKFLKPLSEEFEIPITSFLITKNDGKKKVKTYTTDFLTFQSHSDSMHQAGGYIGHGGIFTAMSHDDAVADLEKSVEICGHGDAFAYPFGDYSDSCIQAVKDAGFLCAVTTEYGRCYPGDDPLLLPRMRMTLGQTLENFIEMVE